MEPGLAGILRSVYGGLSIGPRPDGEYMDLVIVESGAKSKTIQKYLGKGWIVAACNGHVRDLPTSRDTKHGKKAMWASTADKLPSPPWEWTENSERTIGKILTKAKDSKVENIYIATDPDREGEFIAWQLVQIFAENGYENIWRITFNEITKTAVQASIDARGEVDQGLVQAAMVRRFMDRLVGFRSSKFSRSWSLPAMGRVQTPTLGFIVDKEVEREAFVPQPYFAVYAEAGGLRWNAKFHDKDDSDAWVDDKGKFNAERTNDSELANSAYAAAAKGLTIASSTPGQYQRNPDPPFTTDTLLMKAGSEMSWNPRRTMKIAGELYNAGHITYMRTDSTRTNTTAREDVKSHIRETWGDDHLGEGVLGPDAKTDATNVQDAHEAIRPTRPKDNSPDGLSAEQARLYRLIWARFAGSQMNQSRYERISMTANAEGFNRPFSSTASWRVHRGWEAAFEGIRKEPSISPPSFDTNVGSSLALDDADEESENPCLREDETTPPPRYKQHSLVQQMKKEGIGRPSTYAATIAKLLSRKYVVEEKGSLQPSTEGRTLWLEVAPFYDRSSHGVEGHLFGTNFTAEMETNLDAIELGNSSAPSEWHKFSEHFQALHLSALEKKKQSPTPKQLAYYVRITNNLSEEQIKTYSGGKAPEEMTGTEIREILDVMTKAHPAETQPASEKQTNWIASLAQGAELSEADASALVGAVNFGELTGGRKGTASKLIEQLLELTKGIPREASEKQIKWIQTLVTRAELSEADACALVEAKSYTELQGGAGGTASKLITILKKRTGGKKKGAKKKGTSKKSTPKKTKKSDDADN
ncbi:MAG: DNA topoisomerase 1 [Marine Group II euryarchaeote MED-G33]|nr:MAG: DNA topoisomerase 1 [Marine Group II euryarchaeote MED-G33]